VARIVKVLREQGPVKRTGLATATRLSYDALVRYVDWMVVKGLLTVDADGVVHLTEAGDAVYDRLVEWIMRYVGKVRFPRQGR
jgi:predicted transcriptional regulator